jgi:hypothetical protein
MRCPGLLACLDDTPLRGPVNLTAPNPAALPIVPVAAGDHRARHLPIVVLLVLADDAVCVHMFR